MVADTSFPITTLEYRVWRPVEASRHRDPIVQMKGMVTMADYHFRVNVERVGVELSRLTTRIEWSEGKPGECRFVIEAPASEDSLSLAFGKAVQLVGLRAERV
jgi:hypothetical protein